MDKELVMLEITSLQKEKINADRIILGFTSILVTLSTALTIYKFIDISIGIIMICIYFFYISIFDLYRVKHISKYQDELFNIAADKAKIEKEKNETN